MKGALERAKKLKGKKLKKTERIIVELLGNDPDYTIQLDGRGRIMAQKIS